MFRQISSPTDRRTAIAAIVPADAAIGSNASIINIDHWLRTGEIELLEQPHPAKRAAGS